MSLHQHRFLRPSIILSCLLLLPLIAFPLAPTSAISTQLIATITRPETIAVPFVKGPGRVRTGQPFIGFGSHLKVDPPFKATAPTKKVIVFLQGVGSSLTHIVNPVGPDFYSESPNNQCKNTPRLAAQYSGQYFSCIKNALLSKGYSASDFLEFSYNGGVVDASGKWVPKSYTCDETGGTPLDVSARTLDDMLVRYARRHANVRFVLVGHSLGGDIAFFELQNIAARGLPTGVKIDSVVTLDSQLEGTSLNGQHISSLLGVPCGSSGPAIIYLNERAYRNLYPHIREDNDKVVSSVHRDGIKVYTLGNKFDTLLSGKQAQGQTVDKPPADDNTLFDIRCKDDVFHQLGCGHLLPLSNAGAVAKIVSLIGKQTANEPSPIPNLVPVLGGQEQQVIPLRTFGLQWLPDTHISFLRANNGVEAYITSRVESYRFVGSSLEDLRPSPASGNKAIPVLSPQGSGFASDYTGLGDVLSGSVLPGHDAHFRLGFFHAEQCDRSNYTASVGMATSSNDGRTWHIVGPVITGRRLAPRCSQVTGAGQPAAIITQDRQYIYLYYTDWPSSPGATDVPAQIYVARAPLDQATNPAAYHKYDSGQWTPGIGGDSSPVISPPSDSPLYAANVGVSYNTVLGRYLATVEVNDGFGYATSVDGITWTPVTLFARFPFGQYPAKMGATWYSYPSLLDPTAPNDQVTGQNNYLYYSEGIQGIEPHYMVRRSLTLVSGPERAITLPRPVEQVVVVPYGQTTQVPAGYACPWDNPVNGVKVYDDDPTTGLIQVTTQPVMVQNKYYPGGVTCIPATSANIDLLKMSMPTDLRKVDIISVPTAQLQNRVEARKDQSTTVPAGYVCPGDSYINNQQVFDNDGSTGLVEITTQAVTLLNIYGDIMCYEDTPANQQAVKDSVAASPGVHHVDIIHVPGEAQPGAPLSPPPGQAESNSVSAPTPSSSTKPDIVVPQNQPTTVPGGYACPGDTEVNGQQVYDNDPTTALIEVTNQDVTMTNIYGTVTCVEATQANIDSLKASKQAQFSRVDVIYVPGQVQSGAPVAG